MSKYKRQDLTCQHGGVYTSMYSMYNCNLKKPLVHDPFCRYQGTESPERSRVISEGRRVQPGCGPGTERFLIVG